MKLMGVNYFPLPFPYPANIRPPQQRGPTTNKEHPMATVQNFFNGHKKHDLILMTILLALALIGKVAHIPWLFTAGMILAAAAGGIPLLLRAISSLRYKVISIELLVSIAVIGAIIIGEYSEAGIVVWLFSLGDLLEEATLEKTRQSIKDLVAMAPKTALKIISPVDRDPIEVDIDDIDQGDYLLVKTGGQVPVDGVVLDGEGHVDESSFTGEPNPSHKRKGDQVFAGTLLVSGTVALRAQKVGEDTTFCQLIKLVEEAQDSKTEAQRFIDRFSQYYTPLVLLIALITGLVSKNIRLAITILVLGCPGALVIGVPVSTVAGIGQAAKQGILAKGSNVFAQLSRVDSFVFDKTGTLAQGRPAVTEERNLAGVPQENLRLLASVEHESDHPLAQAIQAYAQEKQVGERMALLPVERSRVVEGRGLEALIGGERILVGNERLMRENHIDLSAADLPATSTHVLMAREGRLTYALGISDPLRPDALRTLTELKSMARRSQLILLSGDRQENVEATAAGLPIDQMKGGFLPQDKDDFIQDLQRRGHRVAFVGDGINDSPALTRADVGIAIGSGTQVAIEVSDIVLVKSRFSQLVSTLFYARKTMADMRENIAIAVLTVVLLLVGLFAGYIHMASGMLIHEISILAVILNALRLIRA